MKERKMANFEKIYNQNENKQKYLQLFTKIEVSF
jgi:hypothetical protein